MESVLKKSSIQNMVTMMLSLLRRVPSKINWCLDQLSPILNRNTPLTIMELEKLIKHKKVKDKNSCFPGKGQKVKLARYDGKTCNAVDKEVKDKNSWFPDLGQKVTVAWDDGKTYNAMVKSYEGDKIIIFFPGHVKNHWLCGLQDYVDRVKLVDDHNTSKRSFKRTARKKNVSSKSSMTGLSNTSSRHVISSRHLVTSSHHVIPSHQTLWTLRRQVLEELTKRHGRKAQHGRKAWGVLILAFIATKCVVTVSVVQDVVTVSTTCVCYRCGREGKECALHASKKQSHQWKIWTSTTILRTGQHALYLSIPSPRDTFYKKS